MAVSSTVVIDGTAASAAPSAIHERPVQRAQPVPAWYDRWRLATAVAVSDALRIL